MNVRRAAARLSVLVSDPGRPVIDLAAKRRREAQRRQLNVAGLRLLVAVVFLGSWELTTRLGWVDVFFWSQPSAIVAKTWYWITQGTDLGPLSHQVLTTMESTVSPFPYGSFPSVFFPSSLDLSP